MAFICRINQSKLKHLSNEFKRRYFQISYASPLHSNCARQYVSQEPKGFIPRRPADFGHKVRFFAAPVQAKAKKEEKDSSGPRLNYKIKAEFVRLVTEDGHAIVSRHEALEQARELKLDLVEVQRTADPPVCKIMDFHREKYKQQIKEKDRVKSKAEVSLRKGDHKEVRFSGKTEEKDLRMKADMVKRLMERGYRVKCTARGSEDQDLGGLLSRLSAMIEDVSVVESGPRVERGQAYVIVRHAKFGPSKKGGGKRLKVVANASLGVQNGTVPLVAAAYSSSPGEEVDHEESDFEADSEKSNENLRDNETAWSVVGGNNDFDEVFDLKHDSNGVPSKTTGKKMNVVSDRASLQSDVNVSDLMRARPLVESGRTNSVPLSQQDSSIKTENRYKKIQPMNRSQPTNGMDNKSRGTRDTLRLETQIHDQKRRPLMDTNFSPLRETKREENNTSAFRNVKPSPNEPSKQCLSHHSDPSSSGPSYGIFSSLNVNAPGKQDAAATSYRSNRGPPYIPVTSPNAHEASENTKFANTKPDDNLNKGQRSWGIFSKEDSNDLPNRISKPN